MVKKIFSLIILVLVIVGLVTLWQQYRGYQERKAARIARMQQQAEEVQVTTIEGWTLDDITENLAEKQLVQVKDMEKALKEFDLSEYPLIQKSKPKSASLEGFLFPDTYRFNKQSTPAMVIEKMLDNFVSRTSGEGVKADITEYTIAGYNRTMSFYEILILASIIEKESGGEGPMSLEEERALVAGVFYNRLDSGQALQSDATVNYVTGKKTPGISSADQQINSPYNTYKYPGLPPGPICNPSLSSINAALHPQKTNYRYFFHRQPSGEVVFSETFDQHRSRQVE